LKSGETEKKKKIGKIKSKKEDSATKPQSKLPSLQICPKAMRKA